MMLKNSGVQIFNFLIVCLPENNVKKICVKNCCVQIFNFLIIQLSGKLTIQ